MKITTTTLDNLITPEREYLEKLIIDQLRRRFPEMKALREYAEEQFNEIDYVATDWTKVWPKDIRCCLMNILSFTEVLRLARTCKHWWEVVDSPRFNDYWRSRHRRDFPYNPPTGRPPLAINTRRGDIILTKRTVLWLDIYEFVWCQKRAKAPTGRIGFFPLNRRKLRTFIEHKRNEHFNRKTFPDILKGGTSWHRRLDWCIITPPEVLVRTLQLAVPREGWSANTFGAAVQVAVAASPSSFFVGSCSPRQPIPEEHRYDRRNQAVVATLPESVPTPTQWPYIHGPPVIEYMVPGPLRDFLSDTHVVTNANNNNRPLRFAWGLESHGWHVKSCEMSFWLANQLCPPAEEGIAMLWRKC